MTASREPSLAEVLRTWGDAFGARLRVMLPGRVEKYDPKTKKADVQPLLQDVRVDADGERHGDKLPLCVNVPVVFPGAGGFFCTFPVKKGDVVTLVFADQSLDRWKSKGGEVDPGELRPHDLSNAVAYVGLEDFEHATEAHAENAVFGKKDGPKVEVTPGDEVRITAGSAEIVAKDGKIEAVAGTVSLGGANASSAVALAPDVGTELNRIKTDLDILKAAISGAPIVPMDGGATFKASLIAALSAWPSSPGSVGASKVKAE